MSIDFSKIQSNCSQFEVITSELKKQIDELQQKHLGMLMSVAKAVEDSQIEYAKKLQEMATITEELQKKFSPR